MQLDILKDKKKKTVIFSVSMQQFGGCPSFQASVYIFSALKLTLLHPFSFKGN